MVMDPKDITDADRAAALEMALSKAEERCGLPRDAGAPVPQRAGLILQRATKWRLEPRLYDLVLWLCKRAQALPH
jgi:hypothetical protein